MIIELEFTNQDELDGIIRGIEELIGFAEDNNVPVESKVYEIVEKLEESLS